MYPATETKSIPLWSRNCFDETKEVYLNNITSKYCIAVKAGRHRATSTGIILLVQLKSLKHRTRLVNIFFNTKEENHFGFVYLQKIRTYSSASYIP